MQVFRILRISLERRDQFQPCGKRISSKVFGRSFAAKRKFKEVRRYSIVLVKEFHLPSHRPRSLCEVTCCNAASRCWKFRKMFFSIDAKIWDCSRFERNPVERVLNSFAVTRSLEIPHAAQSLIHRQIIHWNCIDVALHGASCAVKFCSLAGLGLERYFWEGQ